MTDLRLQNSVTVWDVWDPGSLSRLPRKQMPNLAGEVNQDCRQKNRVPGTI